MGRSEDVSANIGALESLQAAYGCEMLFVESGGDNLAANYSRELADYVRPPLSTVRHLHAKLTPLYISFF